MLFWIFMNFFCSYSPSQSKEVNNGPSLIHLFVEKFHCFSLNLYAEQTSRSLIGPILLGLLGFCNNRRGQAFYLGWINSFAMKVSRMSLLSAFRFWYMVINSTLTSTNTFISLENWDDPEIFLQVLPFPRTTLFSNLTIYSLWITKNQ